MVLNTRRNASGRFHAAANAAMAPELAPAIFVRPNCPRLFSRNGGLPGMNVSRSRREGARSNTASASISCGASVSRLRPK